MAYIQHYNVSNFTLDQGRKYPNGSLIYTDNGNCYYKKTDTSIISVNNIKAVDGEPTLTEGNTIYFDRNTKKIYFGGNIYSDGSYTFSANPVSEEGLTLNLTDSSNTSHGAITIPLVTTTISGLMSAEDKQKLDNLVEAAGGEGYLTKTVADDLYAPKADYALASALDNYLTTTDAETNYLTINDARTSYASTDKVNELEDEIKSLTGFTVVVVEQLPEKGEKGILYLKKKTSGGTTEDEYEEWLWVSYQKDGYTPELTPEQEANGELPIYQEGEYIEKWECIGSQTVSSIGKITVNGQEYQPDSSNNITLPNYPTVVDPVSTYSSTDTTKPITGAGVAKAFETLSGGTTANPNYALRGITVTNGIITNKTEIAVPTVTDTYSPTSSNGMSGVAVAAALNEKIVALTQAEYDNPSLIKNPNTIYLIIEG